MLLIPARIRQIKEDGWREGYKDGTEDARQELREQMNKRLFEAAQRFGYMVNGERVLPFTPEVRRFLDGEEVAAPVQERPRLYVRFGRRRQG